MDTVSPSSSLGQLADSLTKIRLSGGSLVSDEEEQCPDSEEPAGIAKDLRNISVGFDGIRGHIFEMQEKRHQRHSGTNELNTDEPTLSAASSTVQGAWSGQVNAAANLDVARLKALMDEVSAQLDKTDEAIVLLSSSSLYPRGSVNSLSSLISFGDAFAGLNGIGISREPTALRRQHDELLRTWDAIRLEANALAREMEGDAYILIFEAFARQAEELLDSLSKALESCHDAVFAFSRYRMFRRQTEAVKSDPKRATMADDEQVGSLHSVKRSFQIKRTTYEPACTQLFLTMERGITQHASGNGTMLRRFGELRLRWQSLRERMARMDDDLGGVECVPEGSHVRSGVKHTGTASPKPISSHHLGSLPSGGASRSTSTRHSKIPRPAVFKSSPASFQAVVDERPSSALSFVSTSTMRTIRSLNTQKVARPNRMYR